MPVYKALEVFSAARIAGKRKYAGMNISGCLFAM